MTITATTADQLDSLAIEIMQAPAANAVIDGRMYAMILEPAQTIRGQQITKGAYSSNVITAINRLRPKGFIFHVGELWAPAPAPNHIASFERKGTNPGEIVGNPSSYGTGATLSLATCGALCRIWAAIIREYLELPQPAT